MALPATQKDIARAVGVSQVVVSGVLRGDPRGRVSEETRRKILETAQRIGYRPNAHARALRTRHSRQIAYLITDEDVRHPYALGELTLSGMAATLAQQGYQLLIGTARSHEQALAVLQEMFESGACEGGFLRALQARLYDWPSVRPVAQRVVILGHCPDRELTSLAFDVEACMHVALAHLLARGHRCIGLVSAPDPVDYHQMVPELWKQAASAAGLESQRWLGCVRERSEGRALAQRWLTSPEAPTALLCAKPRAAIGITDAALSSGKRIGQDLDLLVLGDAVFGEGNLSWLYEPGTWYFDNDQQQMGCRAAGELVRLLEGESPPGVIRVLPELHQR